MTNDTTDRYAPWYATPVVNRKHTLLMGVVNLTPDSFFDGGQLPTAQAACAHALALVRDGAHLLDLGAESSRPGAVPVDCETELQRLLPVLAQLRECSVPLSVDTCHAVTARRALAEGATMLNDISALRHDPRMAEVVAEAGCPCVLMHMQGTPRTMQAAPRYGDVVSEILRFFEERIAAAEVAGIAREQLWIDPGFGFGKSVAHNLTVLRELDAFRQFGLPVLIGTSNKSTIGTVLDAKVDDRSEGTAATVAVSVMKGAHCVRVHDVCAMGRVVRMTEAILHGQK
ncbi:MAG: dihydropteroate synthase [Candidatus Hydrogenedentes bacterium]|nr:dihydropteroate synthase [Candidatus Hydrogenedentota bacterium]